MPRKLQVLRELYKITEMKDGAVYKTKYIRDVWIDMPDTGYGKAPESYLYAVKSTSYEGKTIRSIKVEE